ncbi:MAG: electron transfer flavoprotein subunit beta/FixA family protein [Halanaerobiaceae bacterium]
MNIVVCIKQVPNTNDVKIDPETNTLIRKGVESIINPYDLHAIEEALRLTDNYGGKVTVISMGPPQVKESLKNAISLGVDDVILLSDRAFAGADTLATSYTLARGIEKIADYDLVLCGKQAIDGDTGQVGPGIAEQLGLPHITYIRNIIDVQKGQITAEREIEDGFEEIVIQLPGVLTILKKINEPRLPSIRGILRSREIEVPIWSVKDLDVDETAIGLDGSPTKVVSINTPDLETEGEIYRGKPQEQVTKLVTQLSDKQLI